MNLLQDILVYIRRIIKSSSAQSIPDSTLVDYVNRFYTMDMSARVELFDFQTSYSFQCDANIDQYNMPYYSVQTTDVTLGSTSIYPYPVYQSFQSPVYVNGVEAQFTILRSTYFRSYPNYTQWLPNSYVGDGGVTYIFDLPFSPALRAHIDPIGVIAMENNPVPANTVNPSVPKTSINSSVSIYALDATNTPINVFDSGQFFTADYNTGLLTGDVLQSWSLTQNSVNYITGKVYVTFSRAIPAQNPINLQCYFYQTGLPRQILYYNNVITLRPPPDINYRIDLTATLSPSAFLTTTESLPFAYMAEYIARGAARKILSDTGDIEQFQFYEPLFKEQENLVWKRSQRQITSTRTPTIFSQFGNFRNTNSWPYA